MTSSPAVQPAAVWVYELTDWTRELEPVLQLFGRWAARDPNHRKDLHFGVTSLILSLRTNFDTARVARRKLTITPGAAVDPDATISGDPRMFASVVYGGRPLADAVAAGDMQVSGDESAAERFLSLCTLPPAVGAG